MCYREGHLIDCFLSALSMFSSLSTATATRPLQSLTWVFIREYVAIAINKIWEKIKQTRVVTVKALFADELLGFKTITQQYIYILTDTYNKSESC